MMTKNKPGIVFMGTPEFAVASLDAILKAGYPVKAVITSPDKPSGRGLQMHPSPVKEFALQNHIPVLQPPKLKDPGFLAELKQAGADLQVVVAFRMLPEEVWNMPALGTFNLHASLLPQYRGAAPINWALINGETKTGITTFFLNHEIDMGSVIYTEETDIDAHMNAGELHDHLMEMGARLVVKTIAAIAEGNVKTMAQQQISIAGALKPAPKITKNDCRIIWGKPVETLHNFIRGLSPYPAAWSEINTGSEILSVKIFAATPIRKEHQLSPGTISTDGKQYLHVATPDGFISVENLQLQAKKRMDVSDFLRGFALIKDCRFQ